MRDEFRARFVAGIVEFVPAGIQAEMTFVLPREKRALVMIEPPRQLVGRAVFEIDDGIFAFTEHLLADMLAGFVRQALIFNDCGRIHLLFVKARKDCRGGHSVKTVVVI